MPDSHNNKTVSKNLQRLGLPRRLLFDPEGCKRLGLHLVEVLKQMEVEYSAWESAQEAWFLEALPWHEARVEHNRLKALGQVPEVTWWDAVSFFERAYPTRMVIGNRWSKELGHYTTAKRQAKRRSYNLRRGIVLKRDLKPKVKD